MESANVKPNDKRSSTTCYLMFQCTSRPRSPRGRASRNNYVQYCFSIFTILYGIQNTGQRRRYIVQYLVLIGSASGPDDRRSNSKVFTSCLHTILWLNLSRVKNPPVGKVWIFGEEHDEPGIVLVV
ncbi:hypothetical protein AVEN_132259-1 [Araneus ventricosus]|uniref:Uncharacterized protein n=1 Tax=Araneus ventricosus TaxID=182803 RepID=A0A4Y2QKT4_ARAVE|nr:hypothetical protein AVEN_132259-1 [Araneus ventricosus]